MGDPAPLLTLAEAAARLRISPRTLLGHVRVGRIPYVSVGLGLQRVRRRFDPTDLDRFLEEQRRVDCRATVPARRRLPGVNGIDFAALLEERRAARRAERKLQR
ncbi:helix-turn-helix domain-containing protein [Methylobacterium radiotolerans]|uniref:helix-turn-helix domain-containing protein n=1 Tax=Methylobacterium radiotolerans TaxID=31998 RepID=UPI00399D1FA0